MRKNYEKMFELLVEKKVFKKSEVINRRKFEERIVELGLEDELDKMYNYGIEDVYDRMRWYVYDFSDRFMKFMKSNENYCKYLGNGKYEIL